MDWVASLGESDCLGGGSGTWNSKGMWRILECCWTSYRGHLDCGRHRLVKAEAVRSMNLLPAAGYAKT